MSSSEEHYVMIYDGECNICRQFIRFLQTKSEIRNIEYISYHNDNAKKYFEIVPQWKCRKDLQLVKFPKKKLYTGMEAIQELSDKIPYIKRIAWMYKMPGGKSISKGFYRSTKLIRKAGCRKCR